MNIFKVNFKTIKFAVLLLFIIFQFYMIFIKTHLALDLDVYPNTQPTPHIYQDNRIGQTFVAQRNKLSRIDVMLGTHDRLNDKDVVFELWEVDAEWTLVAKQEFNASSVKNNLYHPVTFEPIKKSEDKKYCFYLYSPESTYQNSISAWMNDKDIYRFGDYIFRNVTSRGDLVFRVYSRRPIFKEVGRIVRNYSGIFGKKSVLILAMIFFVLVQILFLAKLLDFVYKSLKNP